MWATTTAAAARYIPVLARRVVVIVLMAVCCAFVASGASARVRLRYRLLRDFNKLCESVMLVIARQCSAVTVQFNVR